MPPTANIETWLRDVEAMEGLFRVIQIEWLGKPWDSGFVDLWLESQQQNDP